MGHNCSCAQASGGECHSRAISGFAEAAFRLPATGNMALQRAVHCFTYFAHARHVFVRAAIEPGRHRPQQGGVILKRIVVFGNSGSGKSTYAKNQSAGLGCPHMDLDTVAWESGSATPVRRNPEASRSEILTFINPEPNWVVEGCYADLLELALAHATEIVFLNPGPETCVENARNRPWEPHKYSSREAQDANLGMLIEWIKAYDRRTDEFSYLAHRRLFEGFDGPKMEFNSNARDAS